MATGDDALAAGMSIVAGTEPANTLDTEINLTRDYIAQRTNEVTPISKGGTGATTATAARAALELIKAASVAAPDGTIPYYHNDGKLVAAAPTDDGHLANKGYVDDAVAAGRSSLVGVDYLNARIGPSATVPIYSAGGPATSSYTVAYINGDGRVSRGASSERFKENIEPLDPAALGDIWPVLQRFQMIGGDGSWKYGYIAERLAEHPDQHPFVVYSDIDGDPVVASIDFIGLLLAQNAQLHQQLDLLAQRIQRLEG